MPLVTGTDIYGRPVFGVPAIPTGYYQPQQEQPLDQQQPVEAPAPQQPDPYASFASRLNQIKDQGIQSTARAKYVQQQIAQKNQADQENQYMAVQKTTDAVAQQAIAQQQAAVDATNTQAQHQAQVNAQTQQSVSEIANLGNQAFQKIDQQSAQAAKSMGSGRGSVNTQGKTDLRSRIVAMVAREKGIKYQWGGTSEKTGFDCSGLIQYAYGKLGVKMPRTSGLQAKMGVRVPVNRLQPGDLVTHPGHIAVYAGNNMMWEAAHTGTKVRLVPVRSDMYGIHLPQLG